MIKNNKTRLGLLAAAGLVLLNISGSPALDPAAATLVPEISSFARANTSTSTGTELQPLPQPLRVVAAERYEVGQKIELLVEGGSVPNATAVYSWTIPLGVAEERVDDGRRMLLWARPGEYVVTLNAYYTIVIPTQDPENPDKWVPTSYTLPPYTATVQFKVGSYTPPAPEPAPEPAPGPRPGTLGELVPVAAYRALLVDFFQDLADAVDQGLFTTTGHFRSGYRRAISDGKASGALPKDGLTAIDKPISDRLAAAVGLEDVPLDAAKKSALVNELKLISGEFK